MNHDTTGMLLTFGFIGMAVTLTVIGIRAMVRRIRAGATAPGSLAEMAARVHLLEAEAVTSDELAAYARHVAELEERLDFAERLLGQRHATPELLMHQTPV